MGDPTWGLRVVYGDGRASGLLRSLREVYPNEAAALRSASKRNRVAAQRGVSMRLEPVEVVSVDDHGCPQHELAEPPLSPDEIAEVVDEMRAAGLIVDADEASPAPGPAKEPRT